MSPRIIGETERAAAAKDFAPFADVMDGASRTLAALRAHVTRRERAIEAGLETFGTRAEMEAYITQTRSRIAALTASTL